MVELNNIFFSLVLVFIGYFLTKYLLINFRNKKIDFLTDNQFTKPQAFHTEPTYRVGGLIIFFLLILVFIYLYFFKNLIYFEYISFGVLFFFLGFVDDLKINVAPKFRLLIMILLLFISVLYNEIYIEKSGLEFLNNLLAIDIFALFFVCLCFLFIINGSNLIDGFNGLLGIHALIIFLALFIINFIKGNTYISDILFFNILICVIFLIFNFPKAQIFLGDSGAYLLGSLIAISVIKTSISIPEISPFFFCILLFYLFFEVFFSFFRKIFVVRQSPLFPDDKHLHMNLYKFFLKSKKPLENSNYLVSVYINFAYLLLILPGFVFIESNIFCRNYFIFLMIFYILVYYFFNKKILKS